jgi:hypothetical protein
VRKFLLAGCAALALASGARARAEVGDPWILLTLAWTNGAGPHPRDTSILPQFPTKAACQAELKREVSARAGLSNAEGGNFYAICSNINTWAFPQF